jgi:peptidoglycan/xylan/chitin deacetylase (PgdA/CDA1 family)
MHGKVTIVMYHYVRDLACSRYPDIKGLDSALFKAQIAYLDRHYRFVSMEELMDALDGRGTLPDKAVLLTFDDAYIDHFLQVFPILNEHGIPAAFYTPVRAIREHVVLDVNKIHFILAAEPDKSRIIDLLKVIISRYRTSHDLEDDDEYFRRLAKPGRYDGPEVVYIKRLLQRELPEVVRHDIVNELFAEVVGVEESTFSRELYMNKDQLGCLIRAGMHVGNHGYDHYWLDHLDPFAQRQDIQRACEFLEEIGVPLDRWTMCYPYGAHDSSVRRVLTEMNCRLALTTEVAIADIATHDRLALPRLNTNDLPKAWDADVNCWYALG